MLILFLISSQIVDTTLRLCVEQIFPLQELTVAINYVWTWPAVILGFHLWYVMVKLLCMLLDYNTRTEMKMQKNIDYL